MLVLRSTFSYTSTQGMTKKTPGPRAPPVSSLPSLKMTALSYSWTTFTTKIKLSGSVATINIKENMVRARAQIPGPSSQAAMAKSVGADLMVVAGEQSAK